MKRALIVVTQHDPSSRYKKLWAEFCDVTNAYSNGNIATYEFGKNLIRFYKQGTININYAWFKKNFDQLSIFYHTNSINTEDAQNCLQNKIIVLQQFMHEEDEEDWRHINRLIQAIGRVENIEKEFNYFFTPKAIIRDININLLSVVIDLKGLETCGEGNLIAYMKDMLNDSDRFDVLKEKTNTLMENSSVSENVKELTKPIIDSCVVLENIKSEKLDDIEKIKKSLKKINDIFSGDGIEAYYLNLSERFMSIYES